MIFDPTSLSGFLLVAVAFGGAFLAALWLALVIWTWRDIRSRARDSLAQVLAVLVVAVLNLPGVLVYLILRPSNTLEEEYQRTLEEEALLASIEDQSLCPGCERRVRDDWRVCPNCHTKLKKSCHLAEYRAAYLLWGGLVALVSLWNALLVFRLTRRAGWPGLPAGFFAAQSFLFYPIFVSLNKGQDTVFALIGLTVLLLGLQESRERFSGLGLALLTLRPQLALPLAIPFLFRQRKTWWWFVGIALALVVYSVLMVGLKGVTDFLNLLVITSSGESVLIHHADMYNLKGLLMRLFPTIEMQAASGISWAAFVLVLAFLCWLWARANRVEFHHISLAVTLGLFASPHLHYHDISFLFVATLGLCLTFTAKGVISPWQAASLLLAESFYLAIIHITPANYWGVYLLMLALVILAGIAGRPPAAQPSVRRP